MKTTMHNNSQPVQRGDIFWVENQRPTGHEINKTRPAIVVSNNNTNRTSPVIEVVYMSASAAEKRGSPTKVLTFDTCRHSMVNCESVYSVDRSRLKEFVCRASRDTMRKVDQALLKSFGLETGVSREGAA